MVKKSERMKKPLTVGLHIYKLSYTRIYTFAILIKSISATAINKAAI